MTPQDPLSNQPRKEEDSRFQQDADYRAFRDAPASLDEEIAAAVPKEQAPAASETQKRYGSKHFMDGSCACHGQVETLQEQLTAALKRAEAAEAKVESLYQNSKSQSETADALLKRIAELEEDSERLSWLDSKMNGQGVMIKPPLGSEPRDIRSAIDAARNQPTP